MDFIIQSTDRDWTPNQRMKIDQTTLLYNDTNPLEKIPYDFRYKFECDDINCTKHNLKIIDWEANQAFRSFREDYGDESKVLIKLKEKYFNDFFKNPKKESYFIVGNVAHKRTFIIIAYILI